MAKVLSKTFRSLKPHSPNPKPKPNPNSKSPMQLQLSPCNSSSSPSTKSNSISISTQKQSSWSVYLIISTNPPIKTYVGVTTNFSRRLKQHNGERKGGAKASRAGRPWICACIIRGFKDQSQGICPASLNGSGKICRKDCPAREKVVTRTMIKTMEHFYYCNIGKQH